MLKNEGGKVKAGFDTPEAAAAYQLLADMVKDGNGLHATNEEGFQAYLSGKLGMVCTTIGKRANFEKRLPSSKLWQLLSHSLKAKN